MSELTPQQHPAYIEGMIDAARGCAATHNPHLWSKDTQARQTWQEGWTLISTALRREYLRGLQNAKQHQHLTMPLTVTCALDQKADGPHAYHTSRHITIQGNALTKTHYPTIPATAKEQ